MTAISEARRILEGQLEAAEQRLLEAERILDRSSDPGDGAELIVHSADLKVSRIRALLEKLK